MAMKKCKDCGTEISGSAKVCPKCGKDQRNFFQKHIVLTVIGVLFIIGLLCSSTPTSTNTTSNSTSELSEVSTDNVSEIVETSAEISDDSIEETSNESTSEPEEAQIEYKSVTFDELKSALDSNAAVAKETYLNQYVAITGKLSTIDSDLSYIGITSSTAKYSFSTIHCDIKNEDQKNVVKTLSTDDIIVVKGKITMVGEVLGYSLDIVEITK